MSIFKLPVSNVATATKAKDVTVTVVSKGPAKADGTPIQPTDITPDLIHDADPGVAALGQGRFMATNAIGLFKNAA